MLEPVIVVDPEVMSGTPCFRGTRVPFKNLIDGRRALAGRVPAAVPRGQMAVQALEEAKNSLLARIG